MNGISDLCAAGAACTRDSVLLMLPVLAVLGSSVLLILPVLAVFRPPVLQYSHYWSTLMLRVYSEYVVHLENL